MNLLLYPKNLNLDIGYKLSLKEFQCKCNNEDCTFTLVSPEFIQAWNITRAKFGKPLKINSGFRCQKHNSSDEVKGKKDSRHKKGCAIDISFNDLTAMERTFLKTLLEENFTVVLEYLTFYHCHKE